MSKTTPDDVCALCYHHKSEAATCNREDCELSSASSCSAFWAAGWSRLLDKKLAEYRANGSEGEFQCDPIPYRAGAAGGRCAREASERRVAILKQNACQQAPKPEPKDNEN